MQEKFLDFYTLAQVGSQASQSNRRKSILAKPSYCQSPSWLHHKINPKKIKIKMYRIQL
jgi:hypothetical protein